MLDINKKTGDALYASEINQIVNEINNKPDSVELPDFKTINGVSIVGTGNITIEGGSGEVDLTAYSTTAQIANTYQLKGEYLTGVTWSIVSDKPVIPSIAGLASEDFVTSKGYITSASLSGYSTSSQIANSYQLKGNFLTGVTWNEVTGKPVLFDGNYNSLSNRPTIPSIAGLASESFVTGKNYLTGVTWNAITSKPTFFSGSYADLTGKPTIPSIAGLATETFVTSVVATKADLVGGKVPVEQLAPLAFDSTQFEIITISGVTSIRLKQSFIDSLGGGTVTPTPALSASTVTFGTSTATSNVVNWSTVSGATSYVLRRATNSTMSGSTSIYSGSLLTFVDSGLTASTTYYYTVTASANGYTSSTSTVGSKATSSAGGGFVVNRRIRANLTSEYGANVPTGSVTWNNLKAVSLTADQSYLSPALVTETNVASTIRITNIGAWDGAQNSIFDTYGVPANAVYPYEVVGSCWKFARDGNNKLRITGLDDAKYYHLYVGSCDKFEYRTNTIKVGTETKTKSTFNNYGVAGENEFASAFNSEFKNKQSTGGIIEIEVNTVGFYIGFVASVIIEESNSTKP